jgi:hypothetical protein
MVNHHRYHLKFSPVAIVVTLKSPSPSLHIVHYALYPFPFSTAYLPFSLAAITSHIIFDLTRPAIPRMACILTWMIPAPKFLAAHFTARSISFDGSRRYMGAS